jgi:hypothetical protein
MTDDRIGEIWRLPENYCKPLAFGRAIEAECRGVPDYVWMIGTKGFMALFATEEAANDWQQMTGTNTPASYIQPVSIPVISAAPKPDPERKHEIVPTIAAPVAQEPTAFLIEGFDGNGKRVAAVIQQNADNARNSASVFAEHYPSVKTSGLYLAPPDQSAEVSMTPAASIFKDEVARLNAEVDRLRGNLHAMKQNALRDVERIAELERQQAALVEALEEAREEVVGWAAYASEYFQQKHNLQGYVEKLDTTLASVKGNAEVTGVTTGENDAT